LFSEYTSRSFLLYFQFGEQSLLKSHNIRPCRRTANGTKLTAIDLRHTFNIFGEPLFKLKTFSTSEQNNTTPQSRVV